MSAFTWGLLALGGVVLAALWIYSAWTTRRLRPRQPEAAESPLREPVEPSFNADLADTEMDSSLSELPPPDKRPGLDALIDVLAPIALEGPVSGEAALAALPPTRRAGSKPFAIEGQSEPDGGWETPRAGLRYTAFQAGVQLANRTGALNEIEYSEFVMKTQAFADAVNGTPEFPEMLDEVARGRELDQFASAHDAQLSLTLRAAHAAWSPGYVQQHAARLGFVPGAIAGRMVLPAHMPGAPGILSLAFDTQAALADDPTQSAVREVTLTLDVPQVARSEQPFVRLRETAQAMAQAMDGLLTDGQGQAIVPAALDAIGADLEQLYDTLEARDFAAGSALARRLFS